MISKEHKKHTQLVKPSLGNFGRNEWSILGAPCEIIRSLSEKIIAALSPLYKCVYADAVHKKENEDEAELNRFAFAEYSDNINVHQFHFNRTVTGFQRKTILNEADMVLINGNHFQGDKQIVIIHKIKEASLKKRITHLTNVHMIILYDDTEEIFDFVKEALPHWALIPVYRLSETENIIEFFTSEMKRSIPKVNGLVLAGGKSERMGTDKRLLNLHGKEQQYHIADLLQNFCSDVFISCREDQKDTIDKNYKILTDTFINLGPFGAILSALREHPDSAWFVIACDLLLLDKSAMAYLMNNQNVSAVATVYESPHDGFPEPLMAIWEPKSYAVLLSFLAQGYSCPRKVLRNSDITLLKPVDSNSLLNANTPEELAQVNKILQTKNIIV